MYGKYSLKIFLECIIHIKSNQMPYAVICSNFVKVHISQTMQHGCHLNVNVCYIQHL